MTAWLNDAEMAAWRTLLFSSATLLATLDRELRAEQQMTLAEYEVLAFLSEAEDGRLPMAALAERVLVSPSALTRRIDRLVGLGFVERVACESDARVTYAALTPDGRDRLEAAAPTHVRGVRDHFADRLSPAQLDALTDALQAVAGPPPC